MFTEGQEPNGIYLILQGEFSISATITTLSIHHLFPDNPKV